MILTGHDIVANLKKNRISISPFETSQINPNSYDLRLGDYICVYKEETLDTKSPNEIRQIIIPDSGYVLEKNKFYLGFSYERIGSDYFVPILHCKSGVARMGLFIHVTADLIDIGFKGNITFQLYPTHNIKVYPKMKIGQLSFWKPMGEIILYDGKYKNSVGPIPSKSYLDN